MQKTLSRCIVAIVLIAAAVAVGIRFAVTATDKQPEPVSEPLTALYTLAQYDGRIALYKAGYSMPVEIYDVYLSTLPESERIIIENGINADSDEEIQRIIEDYTS